jgi:hypothetical protein
VEGGAGAWAGVLWVDLAVCAVVCEVEVVVLKQGMRLWWPSSTTLATLMVAV